MANSTMKIDIEPIYHPVQFEWKVISIFATTHKELEDVLNAESQDGWEVFDVQLGAGIILRRQLEEVAKA